jgi:transposase-like protein
VEKCPPLEWAPGSGQIGNKELTRQGLLSKDESPWRITAPTASNSKRQVAQEFLAGETLHRLSERQDTCRNLIRVRVQKYEVGALGEDVQIAALERFVGEQALELEFLRGSEKRIPTEKREYVRHSRPPGLSVAEGCRLMGIARSTYYDAAPSPIDDTAIVQAICAICDELESYGWCRVRAELRHRGMVVNHKKIRRPMREHGLQPKMRRRHSQRPIAIATNRSIPNRANDVTLDRPHRLWVADITGAPRSGPLRPQNAIFPSARLHLHVHARARTISPRRSRP